MGVLLPVLSALDKLGRRSYSRIAALLRDKPVDSAVKVNVSCRKKVWAADVVVNVEFLCLVAAGDKSESAVLV